MFTRDKNIYQLLLPGDLGKIQKKIEQSLRIPTNYSFKGNLENPNDLETYINKIAEMISNAKGTITVYETKEGHIIITDDAILIDPF